MYPGPLAIVGLPVHATYHSAPYPRYRFGTLIQPNGSIFQEKATTVPAFRISQLSSEFQMRFSFLLSCEHNGAGAPQIGYEVLCAIFSVSFLALSGC